MRRMPADCRAVRRAAGDNFGFCARFFLSDELSPFAPRGSTDEVEEGRAFAPKFDADGLIVCVVTDARSGDLLMVAHMNAEALRQTIATGEAWYFSRSRRALWRKGESSGHTQRVIEMRIDCDQDAVWIRVEQEGAGACHTGRRSCFYRAVPLGKPGAVMLEFRDGERTFDPNAMYGKKKQRLRRPLPAYLHRHEAIPAAVACASNRRARSRCGRSYITPSMPTVPLPGLASNAATTARACAIAAADGVNTSLMTGTCAGWIAILPVKPSRRASSVSRRSAAALRKSTVTVSMACTRAAAAPARQSARASR